MPTHRYDHDIAGQTRCLDEVNRIPMPESMIIDAITRQPTPPSDIPESSMPADHKSIDERVEEPARDIATPVSTTEDLTSDNDQRLSQSISPTSASPAYSVDHITGRLGSPFPRTRFLPNTTSSYLKPGSVFRGTQQSDRQVYEVEVQLQHVDMQDSFLCGYLKIQGLTDDHPTLTTYFEGEIIGSKYSFHTKHPEWGSSEKVDMQHWGRFPGWKSLSGKHSKRSEANHKNIMQRDCLFMRWKEHFLVPDHRVRAISGASFEGFYYICFNQLTGNINGIYFHAKSEKYQQLELKHVEDYGCMASFEFR